MITSPSNFLKHDSRFKSWGKIVTAADVDLSQKNGYSLNGQWVKWDESVSLTPGKFLICAAETGSRANHSYDYRIIDGDGNRVEKEARTALLDSALEAGKITEEQRVKAENSTLYAYALYIWTVSQ